MFILAGDCHAGDALLASLLGRHYFDRGSFGHWTNNPSLFLKFQKAAAASHSCSLPSIGCKSDSFCYRSEIPGGPPNSLQSLESWKQRSAKD